MEIHSFNQLIGHAFILCAITTASLPVFCDEPRPTPTPRAGTLAAFASTTTLDRSLLSTDTGAIVITTNTLAELGQAGVVTEVSDPIAPAPEVELGKTPSAKTRTHWRKKVMAQSRVIAKLETRRAAVENEINRIERGRLDSRSLDKLEKGEAKLKTVETEIRREKQVLSRMIRDARQEGAQPGWFR